MYANQKLDRLGVFTFTVQSTVYFHCGFSESTKNSCDCPPFSRTVTQFLAPARLISKGYLQKHCHTADDQLKDDANVRFSDTSLRNFGWMP